MILDLDRSVITHTSHSIAVMVDYRSSIDKEQKCIHDVMSPCIYALHHIIVAMEIAL